MSNQGADGAVYPVHDLAEVALMLGGVGAGVELALDGGFGQNAGVGNERGDVALQQHQPLVNLVLIGGLAHVRGQVAIGDGSHISDERGQPIVNAVDGILHAPMIAIALDLYPFAQVAAADQAQNPVALRDWEQNGIQHLVDAANHFRIIALELFGLAALGQLARA